MTTNLEISKAQTDAAIGEFSRQYAETVDAFLRSIGVTESNAHAYEFRTHDAGDLGGEVWSCGHKLGEVTVRFDSSDPSNGYRWIMKCESCLRSGT